MVTTHQQTVSRQSGRPDYIYITGCDGTGKTTQVRLLMERLRADKIPVHHLWMRFPLLLSAPFLAYARLRGFSWYEAHGDARLGYWDFRRSWVLRSVFPWVYLLDALIVSIFRVYLPALAGRMIVCERYVLDMLIDLSVALAQPDFCQRMPGRLYFRLLPGRGRIIILDADLDTLRARRHDLSSDQHLEQRLKAFRQLAAYRSLSIIPGSLSLNEVHQIIMALAQPGHHTLKSTRHRQNRDLLP